MPIETLADIVRTHAADRPDDVALVLGDREVSWSRLYERARRVATALQAAGVGPQDHVALLDKNGIEHFELSYGAALLNAIPVDVNWRLAPAEVAYIVDDCGSKVLVVGPDFVGVVEAIADDLPAGMQVVVIGGHPSRSDWLTYDAWVDSHADVDPEVPSAPDDTVLQLYSSGTTGRPKGVMLSNANLLGLLPTGAELWNFDASSVNLVAMPLFHIGGSGWAIAGQFVGARSVIVRDLDPAQLVGVFAAQGVTHAFVVPAVLQFMLMAPGAADADYSSLQLIVYGASPISEDVLSRSVALLGCDFTQVYGLTETTGAIVHLPPSDHDPSGPNRHRLRSCGLPGPGVGLRIVDPDTRTDVPVGQVGEIWVDGPQIMKGYWNNDAATAEAIDGDGWFRTGDAGYVDEDGYVYIHDRVKDMIVSGGENIYPAEVENVLMAHPAVADVAVIGVPDDKWGETPKAIVVLAPGAEVTAEELIEYSRGQLAKYKCPTSVDVTDALPRNPSGKILKKVLRAPFWAGRERNVN